MVAAVVENLPSAVHLQPGAGLQLVGDVGVIGQVDAAQPEAVLVLIQFGVGGGIHGVVLEHEVVVAESVGRDGGRQLHGGKKQQGQQCEQDRIVSFFSSEKICVSAGIVACAD